MNAPRKNEEPIIAHTKQFSSLQARLALRGHELSALADGSLLVHRWGLHRQFDSLADVEQFAAQVGAAHEF